jgi:PleD family two-component response regulator
MLLPLDRPGELLERADRAMYARKAQRRLVRQAAG